jgi:hypothetical protein
MQRHSDLDAFYVLLTKLEDRIGGRRRLGESHGRMQWSERGVYFFFEEGECRASDSEANRVVRVGTHALTAKSRTTLWKRLNQHRGTLNPRGGNHRGSIFRLLSGQALMKRELGLALESWGRGSTAARNVRLAERSLEERVSGYLGAMKLVFLPVLDASGPESARGIIERNSIALLSNFAEPTQDLPSPNWLGHHSGRERVKRSGLWNNNHVDENYDLGFLNLFEDLIERTTSQCDQVANGS